MSFDPTVIQEEKLRAEPAEAPEVGPAELKRRIVELVRADSKGRGVPTAEHAVQRVAPDLPLAQLRELQAELAEDPAFADVKAVVTPSGRIYLFSEPSLARGPAAERCLQEEAKLAIVERIRRDSQLVALTPAADLERLFPSPEPEKRAALLAELGADERFRDIQTLAGPDGQLHFHSDAYLSGNYGKIMMRAKANDPALAIAELVRDRSRTMPAPTNVALFRDRVFGLAPAQIQAFLDGLGRPESGPQYADVKKLIHPSTGAVYLYSDQHLIEAAAFRIMDWEEVGAAQNP